MNSIRYSVFVNFLKRIVFDICKYLGTNNTNTNFDKIQIEYDGFQEKEDVLDHELLCTDINLEEDDNDNDIIANDEDTIDELKQIHND